MVQPQFHGLGRVSRGLLVAAALAVLAPRGAAETIGMGTVWYDDAAVTTQTNSGPAYGFWAPMGQASLTAFTFTPGSNTTTNDNSTIAATVYLQNLVMVNATSGTSNAAYLTVIDTATSTVVGSSTNSVTQATTSSTQSAGTPWRFDSLALSANKRYAFVFTSTAGVANTAVNAIGADGSALAASDIDPSAGTLTVVGYRLGGFTSPAPASDIIAGTGVLSTAALSANQEVWFSAGLTTTSQSLQLLSGGASDATQGAAITTASGLRKTGTAIYTLNTTFANSIAGDIFVEEGGLKVATANGGTTSAILGSGQVYLINANPAGTAVSQNSVTMSGTSLDVNTAAGNATLNNAVEGAGRLLKSGGNTLTITSTNSFSGNLVINAGTVSVSTVSDIGQVSNIGRGNSGQDSILLVGGTLVYTGAAGSTNRRVGVAPIGGTILSNGTGALSITGSGNIGFNGSTATTARTFTLGGTYVGDANVFGNTIVDYTGVTSLVKTGAGTWALTAANSYTGTTTVSEGTLQVGNNGTTGQLGTGDVSVASGASLVFSRSGGALAVAANLTGSGSVSKTGAGEMSLTGTNSITGSLTVSQGKLAFNSLGAANGFASVTVASGATISIGNAIAGSSITLRNLAGAGTVDTAWSSANDTRKVIVASDTATTFSGALNDASNARVLALEKTGAATLTLSGTGTFSGGVRLTEGTLNVTSGTALGSGALTAAGGTLSGAATLSNAVVLAADLTASVATSSTLTVGAVSETGGARGLTKTGNGILALTGSNTYTGVTTVSAGRLRVSTGATLASPSIVLADGATLETVDGLSLGTGKTLSLGAGSAVAAAGHVGSLALAGGTLNIDFGASANDLLAVTGDLTLTSGTIAFAKATTYGSGDFTIATYTGSFGGAESNVTLSGLSSDGTSRQTFALVNDATSKLLQLKVGGQAQNVRWTGAVDGSWGAGDSSVANWEVTDVGYVGTQGSRFFNGDSVTFDDTATAGSVALGASLTPVTVAFTGNTLAYSLTSGGGSLAGGSLTKSGNASLTLGMANTYAGGTTLSGGRLRLGADGALGSGLLVVGGGRLSAAGTDARAVANAVRFSADVNVGDATDSGVLTFSGAIDLNTGAPRTLTLDSDVVVTGAISNGSLTKAGNGKLTLSGTNSLGVNLSVTAGTVALGAAGVVADTAAITLASGTTLDLAGYSEAVGSLSLASGSAVTAGTITGGIVTLTDNVTFAATLGGTSALVKNGSANLTLASASARSGATTLNAGGLRLGDAAALGTGALTLNAGSLALSDATARTVANNVVLGGDVTLGAAGSGALTLSGTFGLGAANRTLTVASDTKVSGVVSNGSLTKAGNGVLTLTGSNTYTGGTTIVAGNIVATAGNALGTGGTVTLNTAATGSSNTGLLIDGTAGSVTLARAITVANEGTGTATIGSSALGATFQAIFTGGITLAKDVTLTGAGVGDRTQFSAGIGGTGNVTISGSGRVIFITTANTYVGSTTVASGSTLQLSDGTATPNSFLDDASLLTVNGTLNLAKGANNETVGGLAGSGTVQGHPSVANITSTLTISNAANQTFSGTISNGGATGAILNLAKSGAGTQTLSGTYGATGTLAVSAGSLRLTGTSAVAVGATSVTGGSLSFASAVTASGATSVSAGASVTYGAGATLSGITTLGGTMTLGAGSSLGTNLTNASTETAAELIFGANDVTLGTLTNGNAYYGKLTGTGAIRLRSGSVSVVDVTTGAAGTSTNRWVWVPVAGVIQSTSQQFFGLDTGASLTDRRDLIYGNDSGDALVLSSLTGYGSIRGDWGAVTGQTTTRNLVVDQSTDTVFNGALLSHRDSSPSAKLRAVSLTKRGNGTLELAGFVGKQTLSGNAGTGGGVSLTVEAGVLKVTNAYNTTTTNTGAIDLGVMTVTGGTLAFSNQALLNTAGTAGSSRIDLNGGTLQWLSGNTQDLTAGGRLRIVDGKVAQLDTNGNDVTLGTAFALGAGRTGGLTKLGSGTLTLSAANGFTGDVTVRAGTLVAGNDAALGSGAVTVDGGTLNLGGRAVGNAITFSSGSLIGASGLLGNLTLSGSTLTFAGLTDFGSAAITVGAGATLDLNFLNPTNAITLAGGTLINYGNWNRPVSLAGTVDSTLINSLAANTVTVVAGSTVNLTGVSKDIVYQGGSLSNLSGYTGTLTVRGALDLTGGAPASAGTVRIESGSVDFGNNAFAGTVQYLGGAVSNFGGNLNVVGTNVALTAANLPGARLVLGAGTSVTIGAGLQADLRLEGGGIVGNDLNNLTGTVTVTGGQLLDLGGSPGNYAITNSGANIVVESGATLKGSASVGSITAQAGSILAPGNSPGVLAATSFKALSTVSYDFEIRTIVDGIGLPGVAGFDYDTITVSGELDLTGLSVSSRLLLNLITLDMFNSNSTAEGWDPATPFELTLFSYGTLKLADGATLASLFDINSDNFLDINFASVNKAHFSIVDDQANRQIVLAYSAIPEPSTYGLMLGGLALAAAAYRRRRTKAAS